MGSKTRIEVTLAPADLARVRWGIRSLGIFRARKGEGSRSADLSRYVRDVITQPDVVSRLAGRGPALASIKAEGWRSLRRCPIRLTLAEHRRIGELARAAGVLMPKSEKGNSTGFLRAVLKVTFCESKAGRSAPKGATVQRSELRARRTG